MPGFSFAKKMLVIGAIFVLPIALLVIVLYLQVTNDIDFAKQERLGAQYLHVLRPLFFDLEAYRAADDLGRKAAADNARREIVARRIDNDIITVQLQNRSEGASLLRTSELLAPLIGHWHRRASADTLLADMLDFLVAVSDSSKITLDPVLDGYYAGDAIVAKLPRLIDGVAQSNVIGNRVLSGGLLTQAQLTTITMMSAQVSTSADGVARDLAIAGRTAPYLKPRLDQLRRRQADAIQAFNESLKQTIGATSGRSIASAEYALRATAALDSAFALYDATIDGLDDVLRHRIGELVYNEELIFALALVTISAAAATMFFIGRSISRRLGAVTSAIRTIVAEDMTQLVEIANTLAKGDQSNVKLAVRDRLADAGSDEAAVLAQSYNVLVERLAEVNTDLVTVTTLLSTRAFHDGLTGLPNRALFTERVGQMIARTARRTDYVAAVLYLDLDRFKLVNDSLGHLIGDELLVAVARRLEGCIRPGDTLARLGGDEFTLLLEDVGSVANVLAFGERMLAELARPFTIGSRVMYVTASVGMTLRRTGEDSPDSLLRDADIAMYESKQSGKNRCTLFRPEFLEHASTLLQLQMDLVGAVERREFVLFYQPIISLATNRIDGFEALVRWQHPLRGLVMPDSFISAAEESGTIIAMGSHVIEEAGRQARIWREMFGHERRLGISVNVSARQFEDPRLVERITSTLSINRLSAANLHVEVTESAIMGNPALAASTLQELRRAGVSVHLDDFGTGYSSLGYLHQFPVDTIKIDRSFISTAGTHLGNPQIVAAISSLAQSLSMETTVEGIETIEQLDHVRRLNCTHGQGYYFSRPLNAAAATHLLATWDQQTSSLPPTNAESLPLV